jgi:hypothetical protein
MAMNTIPSANQEAPRDRSPDVLPESPDDRPLRSNGRGKAGMPATWIWAPLLVLLAAIVGVSAYSAMRDTSQDRGIRGPADQAAPDAPRLEKERPSSER